MFIETMGTAENTIGKQVMSNVRFADNNPPWKGRLWRSWLTHFFLGKRALFDILMFFWMYSANVGIQLQYLGLRFWQISIVSPKKGDHSSDFQNFQRPRYFWYHLECLARNRCRRWLCGGRGYRIGGQWWTCGHVPPLSHCFSGCSLPVTAFTTTFCSWFFPFVFVHYLKFS